MRNLNLPMCFAVGLMTLPLYAEAPAPRVITVNGNAAIKVAPDQVTITFGVESWDANLIIAKTSNTEKLAKVIAAAKENGVASKDIQTDYISIDPEYQDRRSSVGTLTGRTVLGYFVRRSATMTLRDVKKFETLLSAVISAGANHVQGIVFETSQLRKFRDQARSQAIQAAREKAIALAAELGQKIGKPQSISEGYIGWASSYGTGWGGGGFRTMAQNVTQNAGGASGSDALEPGRISVTADISVTFQLE